MRRLAALILTATLAFAMPAMAQDKAATLADIRQEMSVLYVEVQKLKRELSTTGAAGQLNTSGSVLDRVGSIESELQRLTARTEEMQQRIDRVVTDGTNRIGDLEFRLVELEGGDTSQLGETTTLGGGDMPQSSRGGGITSAIQPADTAPAAPAEPLAVGEQADFDAAEATFASGDNAAAAEQFGTFLQTYPGSPLSARAYLMRGQALDGAGDTKGSAKAYLDAFSADKTGPQAPDALFRLGRALGRLGQTEAACQTLSEVETRFPGAPAGGEARGEMQTIGCQ
ncbi:tol-pal system protein YbgF [Pelagivirga sediminicola]|uniref:Cell division coordinator CpoB n=1 Tax=Pelagivirga sediminicola TaxID=2170575 RepID=A0A2T7G7A5_9RHOB|nr:tol-pal system protein YbgF [Pelagivirga sediminicola]PVA10267.1 tol-pal system protein YbgF [Pelagivirga sediminicola]